MFRPDSRLAAFDCVVFLTWSNWKTEPRSNRYHYASRFARHLPVVFVQPDQEITEPKAENTTTPGVTVLHVSKTFGRDQTKSIRTYLRKMRYRKPLVWVYNPKFYDFLKNNSKFLTVYHATEDYFQEHFADTGAVGHLNQIRKYIDLAIYVSPLLRNSYEVKGGFQCPGITLPNGCDFQFWQTPQLPSPVREEKIAIFQGGINSRLDFQLLIKLVDRAKEWTFWFCGRADSGIAEWEQLRRQPNVKYFGELRPEELRDLSHRATVGLIPFSQTQLIKVSWPLKAYEYAACGLPVVTVPIESLSDPALFRAATTADQFLEQMNLVASDFDGVQRNERIRKASQFDYDLHFERLLDMNLSSFKKQSNWSLGFFDFLAQGRQRATRP